VGPVVPVAIAVDVAVALVVTAADAVAAVVVAVAVPVAAAVAAAVAAPTAAIAGTRRAAPATWPVSRADARSRRSAASPRRNGAKENVKWQQN
jgi:hypothetical protein